MSTPLCEVRSTSGVHRISAMFLLFLAFQLLTGISQCGGGGDDDTSSPPYWDTISTISLASGQSSTLDLDAYVSDADTADSDLSFSVTGGSSTTVTASLNTSTHEVTFKAVSGFSGDVDFQAVASDAEGNSAATDILVTVSPASSSTIAFTSVTDGASYTNPVTFKVSASSDVVKASYYAPYNGQNYSLGESTDSAAGFPVTYTFSTGGSRQVGVDGYNSAGTKVASALIYITVVSGGSSIAFVEPVNGGTYSTSIWLKASGSSDVVKAKYFSMYNGTSYLLGESTNVSGQFAVSYTFSNAGTRQLSVEGYNSAGTKVATASISITVEASSTSTSESGLGVWLWYIEGTGYTHAQLADKLAGLGVKRIYIKVADGTDIWSEAYDSSVPDTYQARGIEAWAWSYNYPGSYSTQAGALTQAAKSGYDGYVLDIEIEFDGKTTELSSLLSAFSSARSSAVSSGYIPSTAWPMYATTWGNPDDHNMHVEIIDQYVDAHMPQTYLEVWGSSYMADPTYWVNYGTSEYRNMGATKPIHHIVSTEENVITADQINEFFEASGNESSIWRVPGGGTSMSIWDDWAQVDWGMYDTDEANINWVSPVNGGWYTNGIWFKVTASSLVKKVKYYAGSYYLGESTDAANNYPVKYTFSTLGERTVTASGYDANGTKLGSKSVTFTVVDESGSTGDIITGVPYYFQYNNTYNPSGSCQNTSLAMLLSFYGCAVTPDQISYTWGTSYAQDPYGLAQVFNSYASKCGIQQRLTAHTDGAMSDVNALLAAGKPVIVHGYFTSYGHVMVLVGFDGSYYSANDPAGRWTEVFKGGYYSSDSDDGKYIKYDEYPVYQAINTSDGYSVLPIWYHEVTP